MKKSAFLLAIIMVLSTMLVGCATNKNDADTTKITQNTVITTIPATTPTTVATTAPALSLEENIVGKWSATTDATDAIVSGLGKLSGPEGTYEFKDLYLRMVITFKSDNNFTIILDDKVTDETADKMVNQLIDGTSSYYNNFVSKEDGGMTFEEYLQHEEGMTLEEYKEMVKRQAALDKYHGFFIKGTYTISGNQVVLVERDSGEEVATLEYDNGVFSVVRVTEEGAENYIDLYEDLAFEKV